MEDQKFKLVCYSIIVVLSILSIVYFVSLFSKDWNTYWLERYEEREAQLNKMCVDEFGSGFIVATQMPNHFTCCKSTDGYNICSEGYSYELIAPMSFSDMIFMLFK